MTKSTKIIAALGVAAGLGIAALPAGAIFADTLLPLDYTNTTQAQDVTVNLTVGEAVTLGVQNVKCATTDGAAAEGTATVSLSVKAQGSCAHLVAGGTNAAKGYTLSVADKDETTALTRDGGTGTGADAIEAVAGDLGGTNWVAGWNLTGGLLDKAAITHAAKPVQTTAAAGQNELTMTYNFATRVDQNQGTYKDVITYTISVNE